MDESVLQRLVGEVRRAWQFYLMLAALLLVGVMALIVYRSQQGVEGVRELASITAFSSSFPENAGFDGTVRLTVRTEAGLIGTKKMPLELIRNCKVGDRVLVKTRGVAVEILPEPCVRRDLETTAT